MTDHPSSDRDELVVAYLDGEATPAERAIVEADAELMARVEVLGEVMAMVGEPVMPPPPEVKRAHIAAAIDVSATAPNVTSLATKRRRFGAAQMAAAAAAVVALFAIPIALNSGDDDAETAATGAADPELASRNTDDGAASGDDGAASGDDGSAEMFTTEADREEAAEEPAEEVADQPLADEAMAEPEAAVADDDSADAAEEAGAAEEADATVTGRLDIELAPSLAELGAQVLPPPAGILTTDVPEGAIDDLDCVIERPVDPATDEVVVQAGTALVGNQFVQYAVIERVVDGSPSRELVVFDEICATIFTDDVE